MKVGLCFGNVLIALAFTMNGCGRNAQRPPTGPGLPTAEVGKPAPEIKGPDSAGKQFALSDYKGKVVLLEFWGNF